LAINTQYFGYKTFGFNGLSPKTIFHFHVFHRSKQRTYTPEVQKQRTYTPPKPPKNSSKTAISHQIQAISTHFKVIPQPVRNAGSRSMAARDGIEPPTPDFTKGHGLHTELRSGQERDFKFIEREKSGGQRRD
jgi:hypothetical protein